MGRSRVNFATIVIFSRRHQREQNTAKLLVEIVSEARSVSRRDLAKRAFGADADLKPEDFDRMRLRSIIKAVAPRIVAFNGKMAAARFLKVPTAKLGYGRLPATIGWSAVYVCPSTSPASGHWSRRPWEELARAVKER